MSDSSDGTAVGAWPAVLGGIVTNNLSGIETLEEYRSAGGYGLCGRPDVYDTFAASAAVRALRGRGGAGFPAWTKMELVRAEVAGGSLGAQLIANGAESEPLSVKDRYIMLHRPHLVLDGIGLAAGVVGAAEAYLYVGDEASRKSLEGALEEAQGAGINLPEVHTVAAQSTFVAGEATAAVRAINTGVARPRDRPPRNSRQGVRGAPTLVSNVETLARVARAVQPTPPAVESPLLVTLSGVGVRPALIEVPYGLPVVELMKHVGVGPVDGRTALFGGFFGGIMPVTAELTFSTESLAQSGGALGCASLHLMAPGANPVPLAAAVADYYAANNARQCLSCIHATRDIAAALNREAGAAAVAVPKLSRWSTQIVGRGACGVPDGLALLLRSLLRHYPEQLTEHLVVQDAIRVDCSDLTIAVPLARPDSLAVAGGAA